jgi:hypothetical protein
MPLFWFANFWIVWIKGFIDFCINGSKDFSAAGEKDGFITLLRNEWRPLSLMSVRRTEGSHVSEINEADLLPIA